MPSEEQESREYVEIGQRLRAAREQLGLSQWDVATLLGTTDVTYGRYEAGTRRAALPELRKLATILHISFAALIGMQPYKKPDTLALELGRLSNEDRDEALRYIRFRSAEKMRSRSQGKKDAPD